MRAFVAHFSFLIRNFYHKVLHNLFAGLEVSWESHLEFFLPRTRLSHPVSKFLRPAFQHRRIQAIFGANLAGAMILVGSVSAAPGALETYPEAEVPLISQEEVVVATEQRFRAPVATIGLSQGFYRFHRGVDLRARVGTPVYPIDEGRVAEVVYGRFGYGRYVLVEHEDGFASLYAHLGNIDVGPNELVTRESQLGSVGVTGWTTGSHLHLEVYEQGVAINPVAVVPLQ